MKTFVLTILVVMAAAALARTDVTMLASSFSPKDVVILKGDTVRWTNTSARVHTSTAYNGMWNSGDVQPGAYYEFTFTQTGYFTYRCLYHVAMGMVGSVRVSETAVDPASFGRVKAIYR